MKSNTRNLRQQKEGTKNYQAFFIRDSADFSFTPTVFSTIIVFNLNDEISLLQGSKSRIVDQNQCIILKNQAAILRKHPDAILFVIQCNDDFISETDLHGDTYFETLALQYGPFSETIQLNPVMYHKIMDAYMITIDDTLQEIYFKSKVTLLLCLLADRMKHCAEEEIDHTDQNYQKILHAKALIENNLSENYTIPYLAREVGTNEQYLKRYFKKFLGKTIFSFATECKMLRARHLISHSSLKINEISDKIGYKHPTHFTKAFKKFFGHIPNSLRFSYVLFHEELMLVFDFL